MKDLVLQGCGTALVTPFTADGAVDYEAYAALVDRQVGGGVHFLVPLATTGETPTLSPEEKVAIFQTVKTHAKGRPLLVGVGVNSLPDTLANIRLLEPLGPDALLVVVRYRHEPVQYVQLRISGGRQVENFSAACCSPSWRDFQYTRFCYGRSLGRYGLDVGAGGDRYRFIHNCGGSLCALQEFDHQRVRSAVNSAAGGRTIGKAVADALKIPCYDSELIEKIAVETGFAKEYVEKFGEYAVSDSLYDNALAGRTYDGHSDADKLWLAQKDVITRLAKEGSCVIVGRCADFILRDIADCLSVFIHASDEKRAERIVSVYGQREEAPANRLHNKDRKRRAYYELYTGTSWGDIANYTVCLDSGVLGTDKCVDIIKGLY